jgi:hypothetical protein
LKKIDQKYIFHLLQKNFYQIFLELMGKIRRDAKAGGSSAKSGTKTSNPGAAQGLVFNTSGYGQHILKNPQVVQVKF